MKQITIGTDLTTGQPFSVPLHTYLEGNTIYLGRKGSGKSTRGLLPALLSLLREDVPIIVFDGGKWPFLHHALKTMTEAAGKEYRVLFDSPRYQGYRLDPFRSFRGIEYSEHELGYFLHGVSGVPYSAEYGVGYFGLVAMEAAVDAAVAVIKEQLDLTIPVFVEKLKEIARHARDTEHIRAAVKMIGTHKNLCSSDDGSPDFLRWDEVDAKKQVVLVSWGVENPASSFFASAVLQSLITHARIATELGKPLVPRPIFLDEFDTLVGPTFATKLTKLRKFGLNFHMLAQSQFQMAEGLAKVILDQADLEIHLSIDPYTQEYLQMFSREVETTLQSRTRSTTGFSIGDREVKERALSINEILEVSAIPGAAIIVQKTADGFKEPAKVFLDHVISPEVYQLLDSLPFPLKPRSLHPPTVSSANPETKASERDQKRARLTEQLRKLHRGAPDDEES